MKININFKSFKKKHINKKNQIIFYKITCKNNKVIENNIASPALKKAINTQNLPQKIHDKLPDVIDVDMDQIMEGVTGDGTQGAAHAEAAQGAAAAIETRFKTIESSLGLTSDVTHDHDKIDGGSYGIVI